MLAAAQRTVSNTLLTTLSSFIYLLLLSGSSWSKLKTSNLWKPAGRSPSSLCVDSRENWSDGGVCHIGLGVFPFGLD